MNRIILAALSISLLAAGCATTPAVPLPESVIRFDPSMECSREPQAGAWDIRAQLIEDGTITYLIVYLNSPFDTIREPQIRTTGIAIYKGNKGNVYFYQLGTVPKSRNVGTVFVEDPSKSRVGSEIVYEMFKLERRENSNCLRINDEGNRSGALGM